MIITASNLQLAGSHASLEYQRRHESLNAGRDGPDGRRQVQLESTSESLRLQAGATRLTLSQEALHPPAGAPPPAPAAMDAAAATSEVDASVKDVGELKITLLRLLVEQLTGRKVDVVDASALAAGDATEPPPELAEAAARHGAMQQAASSNGRAGWGATYTL